MPAVALWNVLVARSVMSDATTTGEQLQLLLTLERAQHLASSVDFSAGVDWKGCVR